MDIYDLEDAVKDLKKKGFSVSMKASKINIVTKTKRYLIKFMDFITIRKILTEVGLKMKIKKENEYAFLQLLYEVPNVRVFVRIYLIIEKKEPNYKAIFRISNNMNRIEEYVKFFKQLK